MPALTPKIKKDLLKAWDNTTDIYFMEISGNTFPIKESLKSWACTYDGHKRIWWKECCSAFDKFIFAQNVAEGRWRGVKLTFKKQKDII